MIPLTFAVAAKARAKLQDSWREKNIDYFTMQVHDESWCPKKCTRSNIHVINKWATTLLIKDNFQYTSLKKPAQIWAPIPKEYKNMPTLFSLQNKSTIYMQEVKPIPSTLNWPPYHPSNKYQHGNRIFSSWCAWLPTQLHLPLPTSQGAESNTTCSKIKTTSHNYCTASTCCRARYFSRRSFWRIIAMKEKSYILIQIL